MHFQVAPRSMTLDDLELVLVSQIFGEFRGILQIWETTTAKRVKIYPYCQQQHCNPLNILFSIMFLAWICHIFICQGLHTCTALAVARLPQYQLGFLVNCQQQISGKIPISPASRSVLFCCKTLAEMKYRVQLEDRTMTFSICQHATAYSIYAQPAICYCLFIRLSVRHTGVSYKNG